MASPSIPDQADVQRVADVVVDRLRHLAQPRLLAVEAHARSSVEALAALCTRVEGLPPRPLPTASARALGDQVSVLVHDLLALGGDAPSRQDLADAHALLVDLRRALP